MRISIIIFLFILGQNSFGQDTIFFNEKWNPISKENAVFFRVDRKEGTKWTRTDYFYKSKQLQMRGTYSSLAPETRDGYFEWYHSNGKLKHKGKYEIGKEAGEHLWFGENGNIEAKENYKNGQLNGEYEEYYPNGKLMSKSVFVNGIQNGWTVYYRENGSKQSEGNFKNGFRNGEWKYYFENGKLEGTTIFKVEYEIKEANMFLQLPNEEWFLTNQSNNGAAQYIFKRNELIDSSGRKIVPAIMIYVEDATNYKQDAILFSINKRAPFLKKGISIDKTLIQTDKEYPLSYKNGYFLKTTYTENGFNHVLYMIHIITKDDKGVQIYLDMTKDIADKYEQEFWTTIKSIKEIK